MYAPTDHRSVGRRSKPKCARAPTGLQDVLHGVPEPPPLEKGLGALERVKKVPSRGVPEPPLHLVENICTPWCARTPIAYTTKVMKVKTVFVRTAKPDVILN